MLKEKEIIFVDIWEWDSYQLCTHHLAEQFKGNNSVLFVESIGVRPPSLSKKDFGRIFKKLMKWANGMRKIDRRLSVLSPLVLPWHGYPFFRWINSFLFRWQIEHAVRDLGMKDPILWVSIPTALGYLSKINRSLLVYHVVDEYAAFQGMPDFVKEQDHYLTREADLVIASSRTLLDGRRGMNDHLFFVGHGVDTKRFEAALRESAPIPSDLNQYPRPMIGYIGDITDSVIDFDLIEMIAKKRTDWSFVFVGHVRCKLGGIQNLPNVHFIGFRGYDLIPGYCKAFDVGLIPFKRNAVTLPANQPLKMREYLACGQAVVSTLEPEEERFRNVVDYAPEADVFLSAINKCLNTNNENLVKKRTQSVEGDDWENIAEEMSKLVNLFEKPKEI